jgi:pimeloyl-ACP methyl ester carboxylesterase
MEGKGKTGLREDPLRSLDCSAASYAPALPPIAFVVNSGSDHIQVRVDGPAVRVIFCGSNDLDDWKSNADFRLVDFDGMGSVHEGYLKAWRGIAEFLRPRLLCYAGKSLYLEGHSRGGSLASVAAADISKNWNEFDQIDTLTTFGAGKFGDGDLCRTVETSCRTIRRYVTQAAPIWGLRDAVPNLPPSIRYDQPSTAIKLFAIGRPSKLHSLSTYRKALKRRQDREKRRK